MRLTGDTECKEVAPLSLKVAAVALVVLTCLVPAYAHFGSCEDHTSSCPNLKRLGWCQSRKQFMLQNCPVSCDQCVDPNCYDRNEKCTENANRGLCNTQRRFMFDHCPHSCEACRIGPTTAVRPFRRTITNPNFECGRGIPAHLRRKRVVKRQVLFPDEFPPEFPEVVRNNEPALITNPRNPSVHPLAIKADGGGVSSVPLPVTPSVPVDITVEETLCGASPITDRFLITAAHCIFDRNNPITTVRLGELDFAREDESNSRPVDYEVEEFIVHPDYDSSSFERYNDIALIKTARRMEFNELVFPFCVSDKAPAPGSKVTGAGFGLSNVTHRPSQLQEAELEVLESSRCEELFRQEQFIPQLRLRYPSLLQGQSIFCASFPERSACQGDSGGPMFQERNGRRFLVGVVGSGVSCRGNGVSILPGLYINVADHIEFIDNNVFSEGRF